MNLMPPPSRVCGLLPPATNLYPRIPERRRRRGPRSALAILRRSVVGKGGAPAGTITGEAVIDVPVSINSSTQPFLMYSIKIRCLLAHRDELCHYACLHCPHMILVQETWLNASIEDVSSQITRFCQGEIGLHLKIEVVSSHMSVAMFALWSRFRSRWNPNVNGITCILM